MALLHILSGGASTNDILLCGDSSGGLLLTQIISHILHPYPSIPPLPTLSTPFLGILLISPWVTFGAPFSSNTVRKDRDYLTLDILQYWGSAAKEGTALLSAGEDGQAEPGGYWGEPMKATSDWWSGVDKIATNIFITSGEWEVLHDDIQQFGKAFKEAAGPSVQVDVVSEPNGIHIGPVFGMLWDLGPNQLTDAVINWVYERMV
ncbi:hypothetical protein Clacol_009424 [Clathrus columnatus]|uniref:Alpha/beta hydrolase fold-3 domain-containing protein n=1 Tax=Clathrus columnatus TaxID=1419009 RepID=A0AAV5AKK0_9AGAM|nr:hypothetical protein Clacol_009424 [Clathrus columnatus]